MLEGHVQEGAPSLGEHFAFEPQIAVDVDAPVSLGAEDLARTDMYRSNAERAAIASSLLMSTGRR